MGSANRSSQYEGSSVTRRLTAAQALVVPRRVGPFELAGLYDLVLTGARVEVFLDRDMRDGVSTRTGRGLRMDLSPR